MGQVSSAFDPSHENQSVPDGYVTPTWPGLYIPTISSTFDQEGVFLYEAEAIWRFTFYWTLAILGSIFLASGLLASLTSLLSLTIFRPTPKTNAKIYSPPTPPIHLPSNHRQTTPLIVQRHRRKRPPLWPVFLVPIVMAAVAALVSIISATVVGFALAAVYSAGGFSMSTWVPLLWALIQVLVLIISSYSTLTSIL